MDWSAAMRMLLQFVVVKELKQKIKISIYVSVCVPFFFYNHEMWVIMDKM